MADIQVIQSRERLYVDNMPISCKATWARNTSTSEMFFGVFAPHDHHPLQRTHQQHICFGHDHGNLFNNLLLTTNTVANLSFASPDRFSPHPVYQEGFVVGFLMTKHLVRVAPWFPWLRPASSLGGWGGGCTRGGGGKRGTDWMLLVFGNTRF